MNSDFDVVILGGGVIGSSIAMHLAEKGLTSVAVVDPDLEGRFSSSELNAGGVRATFLQDVNIALSKRSIEFFEKYPEEVGYRAVGYLWMFRNENWSTALETRKRHLALGWEVQEWTVRDLRERRPFIDKTDDLAGAFFSPRDGLVNPNRLKQFFRERAKKNGVQFIDHWALSAAERVGNLWKITGNNVANHLQSFFVQGFKAEEKESQPPVIRAKQIINATGAWAPVVSKILGVVCPSIPVKRQISLFDCRDVDLSEYGMMVDPSGVYFHPEATNGLAGLALPQEAGYHLDYDGPSFFEEHLWPALYERSTCFERLKHVTGWAGLYEVSPDETAIIGPTAVPGIYDCHSFSGHGVMQAYAAGEALADYLAGQNSCEIDLEAMSVRRFETGKLIPEKWVI